MSLREWTFRSFWERASGSVCASTRELHMTSRIEASSAFEEVIRTLGNTPFVRPPIVRRTLGLVCSLWVCSPGQPGLHSQSVFLFFYLISSLSLCLAVSPFFCASFSLSLCRFVALSLCLVCLLASLALSVCRSVCLSVFLSICPSLRCLSVSLLSLCLPKCLLPVLVFFILFEWCLTGS